MSERKPPTVSEGYRIRAQECRIKAQAFRDERARTQMLQLAADYERKAIQAEAHERGESLP